MPVPVSLASARELIHPVQKTTTVPPAATRPKRKLVQPQTDRENEREAGERQIHSGSQFIDSSSNFSGPEGTDGKDSDDRSRAATLQIPNSIPVPCLYNLFEQLLIELLGQLVGS